ncbi:MAG: TRAM domain-containing protein [Nanoarchaeota archaeon]|nr:TRAM domain-containing protein [Nanoarchaeota archaeon]
MNGRNNFAPVKEGDELEVKIEAVGEKGDGIAKVDGFVLFVPKTKAGEVVKVRVTRVLKNVGFAEKIGESQAPAEQSQEAVAEEPQEEEPAEPEQHYEDTEDFGEEPAEEAAEEPKEE